MAQKGVAVDKNTIGKQISHLGRDLKNLIIHLVELQYLNNLKCWAILE
jgi:hypothetical protein